MSLQLTTVSLPRRGKGQKGKEFTVSVLGTVKKMKIKNRKTGAEKIKTVIAVDSLLKSTEEEINAIIKKSGFNRIQVMLEGYNAVAIQSASSLSYQFRIAFGADIKDDAKLAAFVQSGLGLLKSGESFDDVLSIIKSTKGYKASVGK